MATIEQTIWCKNCGVEISWGPVMFGKYIFCCQDCLEGMECECGQLMDQDEDWQKPKEDSLFDVMRRLS